MNDRQVGYVTSYYLRHLLYSISPVVISKLTGARSAHKDCVLHIFHLLNAAQKVCAVK